MLSIGAMAQQTGVKVATIRYYEQIGLLNPPERSEGNQRRYGDADLKRLHFVRHARELGLSLGSIRELIELGEQPGLPCATAHDIAHRHLKSVRQRIVRLRRLEGELKRISNLCDGNTVGDCDVIHALADHDQCVSEH